MPTRVSRALRYRVEPLEPRLLLAADWAAGFAPLWTPDAEGHATDGEFAELLSSSTHPVAASMDVAKLPDALDLEALSGLQTPLAADAVPASTIAVTEPPGAARTELIVFDAGVEDDERLLDDLRAHSGRDVRYEVHILEPDADGVQALSDLLKQHRNLDAVHLVSHGADTGLQLGNTWLDAAALEGRAEAVAAWSAALDESADLLLYGCNLAGSATGISLIDRLSELTGADVAASDDLTGSALLGGDWALEHASGDIETLVAFAPATKQSWSGVLATFVVNDFADTVDANLGDGSALDASGNTTLRAAVMEASALAGADTINLPAGTYLLNAGGGDGAGDLDVKAGALTIIGAGADTTVIDGQSNERVFHVISGAGSLTISGVTIQNGNDNFGGGIRTTGGVSLTITDAEIRNNTATVTGGAISADGPLVLERVTIADNTAPEAGGVKTFAGRAVSFTNVTISGNDATAGDGGGLYNEGNAVLRNVTITDNTASGSGGGIIDVAATTDIANSIVYGNTAGTGPDINGTIESAGFNLIGNNSGASGFDGSDTIGSDPTLGTLQLNGGTTRTHALLAGSPAIDPGGAVAPPADDQRGYARDALPDIGAFEFGAALTHTSYETGSQEMEIKSDQNAGQTFSHVSGGGTYDVNQISVQLRKDAAATSQSITLSLRTSWNGADLASAVIASNDLGTNMVWHSFDVGSVTLNDGQSYFIRVTTDTTSGKVYAAFDDGGTYADGDRLDAAGSPVSGEDYLFRVQEATNTPGNSAPVLADDAPSLTAIAEDDVSSLGDSVAAIVVDGSITDADGAVESIAITAVDDSNGTWQYSTDNGGGWNNVDDGSLAVGHALLLDGTLTGAATQKLRFVPDAGFTGIATFTFRAWDQTSGGAASYEDTTSAGGATAFSIATDTASIVVGPTLWLSTLGDVASPSGVTGLDSWANGTALSFGDPNLSLGSGTSDGTMSSLFNLDGFVVGNEANVDGLHYVTTNITVGGANAVALQVGDVLFSTSADEQIIAGAMNFDKTDVVLFRPDTVGDYASGTFSILLDDLGGSGLTDQLISFTLIEKNTSFGDTTLQAGDFLFTRYGSFGLDTNDVYLFETTDVGTGTTSGTTAHALNGDDLGITGLFAWFNAMELIEREVTIGGETLAQGTLLLNATDAPTALPTLQSYDIFALAVTQTELVTGSTAGGLSMILDGSDIGLGSFDETINALALGPAPANSAPTDIDPNSFSIDEHVDTSGGYAVGTLTATDPDSGETFTYTIQPGLDGALFSIAGGGDELRLDDGVLDFETKPSYSVKVRVADAANNTYDETLIVNVNNLNDAPVLADDTPGLTAIAEDNFTSAGDSVAAIVVDGSITDADGTAVESIAITAVDNTNGTWQYSTDNGGSWNNVDDGSLAVDHALLLDGTLTGAATQKLRFVPSADYNGSALFTFRAWDTSGGSAGSYADTTSTGSATPYSTATDTASIVINAVNDEPSFATLGNQNVLEDSGPHTVAGFATPAAGGGADEAGQTFTYSVSNDNAGLFAVAPAIDAAGTLTYTLNPNVQGTATVTVSVRDSGGTANGGDDTSPDQTFDIVVTPVNDAPAGTDKSVTTFGETAYTFSAQDFGFSDPVDGDTLQAVVVTTVPGAGTLSKGVTALTGGETVTAAEIAAGDLAFTPAAGGTGEGYTSFTFRVQDDGGTAGGGVDTDPTANTITIDVAPATLWLNTKGDNDPSDTNLAAWNRGDVVSFGEGATFGESSTTGAFGYQFALTQDDGGSVGDANLRALHYVTRTITVGGGANTYTLEAGDVIAALYPAGGTLVSTNTVDVIGKDVFVFRPDAAGDYSSGTFTMLLENPVAANIHAISLVESTTDLGSSGYSLAAGSFLIAHSGDHDDVFVYAPTSVGAGATAGAKTLLLKGAALGFSGQVQGLELLEENTTVGDTAVAAGRLLITLDKNNSVAGVSVTAQDVVELLVTDTEAGSGTAASAAILLDGSEVALGEAAETFDGLTLATGTGAPNAAPAGADNTVTTLEDTPHVFAATDFGFSDPADGDALLAVKITTLPGAGTLTNNAVAVTAGDTISELDIAAGKLAFSPAAEAVGSNYTSFTFQVQDDGGTANGGVDLDVTPNTLTIAVTSVNDAPAFTTLGNQSVNEDSGPHTVAGFATPAAGGGADEGGQTFTYTVNNDNAALFAVDPAIDATGTLTYTLNPNAAGSATVTVSVADSGGTANGGDDTSPDQTFDIVVAPVNDEPSFSTLGNQNVLQDSGPHTVAGFATPAAGGGADEAGQTFTYTVSNNNAGLFAVDPAIDASGTLSYTLNAGVTGSATVTVSVTDSGGTANGGNDTSPDQTFNIVVVPSNIAPDGADATRVTLEDTVYVFAAADFGFSDVDGHSLKGVRIASLPGAGTLSNNTIPVNVGDLVSVLDIAAGKLAFTPASNGNGAGHGSFTFQVQDDGGTANGGVDLDPVANTITIDVTAVNDAPSFTTLGNQGVNEDSGAHAVAGFATPTAGGGADEGGQTFTYTVINDNTGLFAIAPAIDASGTLTYTLNPNVNGSAKVTVSVKDSGGTANGGDDAAPDQSFDIIVAPVNDEPSFTTMGNQNVAEDSGAHTVASFASALPGGAAEETAQTFSYTVGNDNVALFAVDPTIDASGTLSYTLNPNAAGIATVTVSVTDSGGTANGGDDTSPAQTFDIVVAPVNDPPLAADTTVNILEGSEYVFSTADFGFSDAADGDALRGIEITTLPGVGTLTNDRLVVTAGDSVSAADIVAGRLVFTPAPGANGATYASFTFRVQDDGGTAGGGVDLAASANRLTIGVTVVSNPVPPPVGGDPEPPVLEPPAEVASPDLEPAEPEPPGTAAQPSDGGLASPSSTDRLPLELSAGAEVVVVDPSKPVVVYARAAKGVPISDAPFPIVPDIETGPPLAAPEIAGGERATLVVTRASVNLGLERMRNALDEETGMRRFELGQSTGAVLGLSVGYVSWLLRGGVLLSSVLSSLPAWRFIDPLPVFSSTHRSSAEDDEDDESLEAIVEGGAGADAPAGVGADDDRGEQAQSTPTAEDSRQ